jgi:methyltransferase family protein
MRNLSAKKRLKQFLFDRYFRWEVEALMSSTRTVVNVDFEKDLFMWFLSFINPGMLNDYNIRLFDHCVQHLPSAAPLVEIGSFAGLSLNTLVHLLRKHDRPNSIFSVDEWTLFGEKGSPESLLAGSHVTQGEYRTHTIETFRRNVTLFSGDRLPHHIAVGSDVFFQSWGDGEQRTDLFGRSVRLGGPISFAYIDGDHSYEQSRRDFENVDHYLEVGGFIVFDDSADSARSPLGQVWGSNRTAREAETLPRYRVVDKSHHYCLQRISS